MKFNDFGKVKKEEIILLGLTIIEEKGELVTYSELKKQLKDEYGMKINWDNEKRASMAQIWLCNKNNRGCSPLYVKDEIYVLLRSKKGN